VQLEELSSQTALCYPFRPGSGFGVSVGTKENICTWGATVTRVTKGTFGGSTTRFGMITADHCFNANFGEIIYPNADGELKSFRVTTSDGSLLRLPNRDVAIVQLPTGVRPHGDILINGIYTEYGGSGGFWQYLRTTDEVVAQTLTTMCWSGATTNGLTNPGGSNCAIAASIPAGNLKLKGSEEQSIGFYTLWGGEAPVRPGDSGGPVYDPARGVIVGILHARVTYSIGEGGVTVTYPAYQGLDGVMNDPRVVKSGWHRSYGK
jgi:hypothetical protein